MAIETLDADHGKIDDLEPRRLGPDSDARPSRPLSRSCSRRSRGSPISRALAFDAALLSTAFGLARRPIAVRESLRLARSAARRPQTAAAPLADVVSASGRILRGKSSVG